MPMNIIYCLQMKLENNKKNSELDKNFKEIEKLTEY